MNFIFNIYALVLLVFAVITLFVSFYILKKEGGTVRWFGLMMLSNSIWSLGYSFELASRDLWQILSFIDLEYIGIATVPLNWFFFVLTFCGKETWLKKKRNIFLISAIPLATIFLVWTNELHHLHYKTVSLDRNGAFTLLSFSPGIWYRIFTVYFYVLLAIGCYHLILKIKKSDPIYKKQNYSILIAALIPWLANLSYLFGYKPFGHLDITPYAFIATVLFILIGIYRFKLFDIIPVAREKVLDLMQDGFVVLDRHRRVIDYNLAATHYMRIIKRSEIIGSEIGSIFPNQNILLDHLKSHRSGKVEFNILTTEGENYIEADVRYLDDNKINNEAIIIKFMNLTSLRRDALMLHEQAEELQRLNQLKDRVFSIIAHDLRGPLINLAELLKMTSSNLITLEEFKTLSPVLNKDILYTTELLENILHWSRSQLKDGSIRKESFDLKNLVINEVNYYAAVAREKDIKIVADVASDLQVYADKLMIQIVVRNIIINAIKFCSPGCHILIEAKSDGNNQVKLCIEDNGTGIKEDILNKILSYENVTTRGTMNEKGTGLGLLVCKDFIQRNNGTLSIESIWGKGSKFCIRIPLNKP